jgi:23S rRNA A2030 N6-methylase RlmJ
MIRAHRQLNGLRQRLSQHGDKVGKNAKTGREKLGKIWKHLEKCWGKNAQKFLNMIRNHASSTTLKFSPGLPILASPLLI